MRQENIIREVLDERDRQDQKWGNIPEQIDSLKHADHELLAILTEEVGECARTLNDHEPTERKERELIQVMASAMLWLEILEYRNPTEEKPDTPQADPEKPRLCRMTARITPDRGEEHVGTCFLPDGHRDQHVFVQKRGESAEKKPETQGEQPTTTCANPIVGMNAAMMQYVLHCTCRDLSMNWESEAVAFGISGVYATRGFPEAKFGDLRNEGYPVKPECEAVCGQLSPQPRLAKVGEVPERTEGGEVS